MWQGWAAAAISFSVTQIPNPKPKPPLHVSIGPDVPGLTSWLIPGCFAATLLHATRANTVPCVQNSLHGKHYKKSSGQGARDSSMSLGCTCRNCIGKNSIWRNCTQRNRNPQELQHIQLLFPFPLAPARPLHPLPFHHLLGGQCQAGRRPQGWRRWSLAAGGWQGCVCVLTAALAWGPGLEPLRKAGVDVRGVHGAKMQRESKNVSCSAARRAG